MTRVHVKWQNKCYSIFVIIHYGVCVNHQQLEHISVLNNVNNWTFRKAFLDSKRHEY